jgi:hypothetical protein
MAWTEITRVKYRRDGLRYASDTTDEEWALIEPHMPAKFRVGRPRQTKMRVLDAIFYIIETGCQWRMLPKDFPAIYDRTGLFLPVAGRWTVGIDQPSPVDAGARGGWARGEPVGRGDR